MVAAIQLEELQVEIRLVPMAMEGVRVELVDGAPQRLGHLAAQAGVELDARLGDPAPFALGLLALLGREGGEEIIEGLIAAVVPVELAVAP